MKQAEPSGEEWQRLYEVAVKLKETAPWEWMTDSDIFGVRDPESDELGFVSVMGMLGEHLGIAVYLGADGFHGFWGLQESAPGVSPQALLEIPFLQASFEDRDLLDEQDRGVIKRLGLRFRGRQAWPFFRSYRPGFHPWYLEAPEARFLLHALEQVIEVAPRFRSNPALLQPPGDDHYLVRVPRRDGEALVWEDQVLPAPEPEFRTIVFALPGETIEEAEDLPRVRNHLEMDCFMSPSAVRERDERPCYPYILLVVHGDNGMILGLEMLAPTEGRDALWAQVPGKVVEQLMKIGVMPEQITVSSPLLAQALKPLARRLGIRIREVRSLPALDPAKAALFARFG